jgi:hypothetical protein
MLFPDPYFSLHVLCYRLNEDPVSSRKIVYGNALCRNNTIFTPTVMFFVDLVLLARHVPVVYHLEYHNFSISRSFVLGPSIWMP